MTFLWEQRDKVQALAVIVLAIVAWRRGGGPERWSALVLLGMIAVLTIYKTLSTPTQTWIAHLFGSVGLLFVATDLLAMMLLVAIAVMANRFYPIVLAGCQLVSMMTHFASSLLRKDYPFAYALFNILPFYCMIAVLTVGVWAHLRRARRLGSYPSWRGSSDHSLLRILMRPPPPAP